MTETWEIVSAVLGGPDDENARYIVPFKAKSSIADRVIEKAKTEAREAGEDLAPYERRPATRALLDIGGIAAADRKMYALGPIDGLGIDIPAKDVEFFADRARELLLQGPGKLVDGAFVLGSWPAPLVVGAAFLEQLSVALEAIMPEARAFASAEAAAFNAKFVDNPHPNVRVKPRGPVPGTEA